MEKLLTLKERFEVISLECLIRNSDDLAKGIIKYRNIMKIMYGRFRKVSEELQRTTQDYFKCLKRLDIFEKYENLGSLNEAELEKLEKHLLKGFDIVKDERFRRKYEKDLKNNYSQISHQSNMDSKERQRRKNYETILNIIENFLDFDQIQAEIDFDLEEDLEEYHEKESVVKVIVVLKEKLHKIYEEIMNDGVLRKKIQELEKSQQDFHQRFELTIPEKKYEDIGLFEDTVCDSFLENFVDDKKFLGENLPNYKEKTPTMQTPHQFLSPLERPVFSTKEIQLPKLYNTKNAYNSYEDLLENLNTSFKIEAEEERQNKGEDVSFEDRSQKDKLKMKEEKEEYNDSGNLLKSLHKTHDEPDIILKNLKKEVKKKEISHTKSNVINHQVYF